MSSSIRSRFLLLALAVLLPGIVAMVWVIGTTYTIERQAIEHRLGDSARALSRAVEGELMRRSVGADVAAVPADAWQQVVGQPGLPPGWVRTVIDPAGAVVARHPGQASDASRPAPADLQEQRALRLEGLMASHGPDGGPVMAYFNTSPHGWTAVTAMPRSQFTATVTNTVQRVAAGAMGLLVLALVGAWWAAWRIAAPIDRHENPQALSRAHPTQRCVNADRVEVLGRLTGGVAHDFNNLLGVISNSAHLIQRQARDLDVQAPVAATLRAVEAGSQLTQHLMRFATRQATPPQPVDLSRALPEWHALLKAVAGKQIDVSIAVAPGTRPILADPSALELALTQLTLNARDAMPSGGRLRVQACNATAHDTTGLPAAAWVLITVGDDGQADVTAHRSDPSTRPETGQAQVHEFCMRAGGTSRMASTPGLGTTVSMLLPAC